MAIIDSQVHVYEANTPKRPWHSVPNWPAHVTGDEMVAAIDKVGVDGAIFISSFSMYQYDASYAVEVQRAHPGRFALVKPVDPNDPAVADVIADWKKTPGTVGIRVILKKESGRDPKDPMTLRQPAVHLNDFHQLDLTGVTLGVYRPWFEDASPEIVHHCRETLAMFEESGAVIKEVVIHGLDAARVAPWPADDSVFDDVQNVGSPAVEAF